MKAYGFSRRIPAPPQVEVLSLLPHSFWLRESHSPSEIPGGRTWTASTITQWEKCPGHMTRTACGIGDITAANFRKYNLPTTPKVEENVVGRIKAIRKNARHETEKTNFDNQDCLVVNQKKNGDRIKTLIHNTGDESDMCLSEMPTLTQTHACTHIREHTDACAQRHANAHAHTAWPPEPSNPKLPLLPVLLIHSIATTATMPTTSPCICVSLESFL